MHAPLQNRVSGISDIEPFYFEVVGKILRGAGKAPMEREWVRKPDRTG
jgi:hypothetical protein